MSKLSQIRKALQENPQITIVRERERDFLFVDGTYDNPALYTSFYLAPAQSIYDADDLQELMMSLFPELNHNEQYDFAGGDNGYLSLGLLGFREEIGEQKICREISITDEEVAAGKLSNRGFVDGKMTVKRTEKIQRTISVRLFPNTHFATKALDDLHGHERNNISKYELQEYRKKEQTVS